MAERRYTRAMPWSPDDNLSDVAGGPLSETPRPMNERASRLLFWYRRYAIALIVVSFIVVVPFGGVALFFCRRLPDDVRLSWRGAVVEGSVLRTADDPSITVNEQPATLIDFSYSVDGREYVARSSVFDADAARRVAEAGRVPVQYLPSKPEVARIEGTMLAPGWPVGLVVLPFMVLTLGPLLFVAYSAQRTLRAWRYGVPVQARVTALEERTSTSVNGRHPWVLRWTFEMNDASWTGSLTALSDYELRTYADAKELTVLALRGRPSVNVLYVP